MSATPRLFVEPDLLAGARIQLVGDQAHYLTRVMRLGAGAPVRLFNGRDGEFDAAIAAAGKHDVQLALGARTREQASPPDLWLLFTPLKKTRTDFVVEKAAELGVSEIRPVLTARCEAQAVRIDRLQRIAVEAAEQTERLDVPPVREAVALETLIATWDADRPLYFADESGDSGDRPWGGETGRARPMHEVVAAAAVPRGAVLVGPEGGFTPAERTLLRSRSFVAPVGLGPRILRAETAAVAALTIWQISTGDWRLTGDAEP
jgi:16S rRNA (uracil1498-N3)-methyltransferase